MTYKPSYILISLRPGLNLDAMYLDNAVTHEKPWLVQRRTIPISSHTSLFNIFSVKILSQQPLLLVDSICKSNSVADVYKSSQKIRPGIALVVGKGAQQGQNKSG